MNHTPPRSPQTTEEPRPNAPDGGPRHLEEGTSAVRTIAREGALFVADAALRVADRLSLHEAPEAPEARRDRTGRHVAERTPRTPREHRLARIGRSVVAQFSRDPAAKAARVQQKEAKFQQAFQAYDARMRAKERQRR